MSELPELHEKMAWRGLFRYWIRRGGKLLRNGKFPNGATTVGRNAMLNNFWRTSPTTYAWYAGLIGSTSYTTGLAAADTSSSHAGWVENTDYDEATRQAVTIAAAASALATSTAAPAVFTISATVTIKGIFVISVNTKGATTGVLAATGLFAADQDVLDNDTITLTYENELLALN